MLAHQEAVADSCTTRPPESAAGAVADRSGLCYAEPAAATNPIPFPVVAGPACFSRKALQGTAFPLKKQARLHAWCCEMTAM